MGRKAAVGLLGGAISGGLMGGPPGAIIGGLIGGLLGKGTEPKYNEERVVHVFHHKDKNGCFIATACYGVDTKSIEIFRRWRDDKLLKNDVGKKFVNLYYFISPPIAQFIYNRPILKKIVRGGLYPLKELIKDKNYY